METKLFINRPAPGDVFHLVGIAGVGMSSLAQALAGQGVVVTGSDRYYDDGQELDVVRKLIAGGVRFFSQDGQGISEETTALVVSTAIENDNPDIHAARKKGVPILHRAEVLARLVDGRHSIAVTGTSGKTTVTGMLGWILEQLGQDPSVVNGGISLNWQTDQRIGNVRIGRSDLWVIEADESDKSLMHFHPDWAIITNVSHDHFDADEAEALFRRFSRQVGKGCISALNRPDFLVGFKPDLSSGGSRFIHGGVEFQLGVPGYHNAENALFAVALCERLGFPLAEISSALAGFKGIHRRLERVGTARGVNVFDDYGHNPAKIRAAWITLAAYFDRIIAVWRPHGFRPMALMEDGLVEMFGDVCRPGDLLYILPVYDAGGTAPRGVTSQTLVTRLQSAGHTAVYADPPSGVVADIAGKARAGDAVLVMGARDPGLPLLARQIFESCLRG